MINILHITPNFNYNCGRSKLVYLYLKYLSNTDNYETHFITNGGDSLDRLKELPNLRFDLIDFSTGCENLLYGRSFYKKLKNYIIDNEINLIHTHHRFPELISVRIAKEFKIKTITSAHSFVKGYQRTSFKSDKIIAVSNSLRNYLINNYRISDEKIITLYNPVDQILQPDFELTERFKDINNITSDSKVLLFVGRITKDKGFDTVLQSFDILSKLNNNVFLVMVGQIVDKVRNHKSILENEKIIFLSPEKDISHLYSVADVVLLPSRIEPFGLVMIEAGSFKKPFIGGNTGGIAEFIEDGKNGLLVDPEDPEQLGEKIIYLLDNAEIGKVLGENLFEKVNRLCNYNNYFNEVEKIYNSLIALDDI